MHQAPKTVREQELLRLLLIGHSLRECSTMMEMSYQTMRKWAADPAFLSALKELSASVFERVDSELQNSKESLRAKLEEASEHALDRIINLAQQEKNDHIALKAAQDLLDRDGRVSRQTKVSGDTTIKHTFLDPLTLVHAVAAAKEMDKYEERKNSGALPPADAAS